MKSLIFFIAVGISFIDFRCFACDQCIVKINNEIEETNYWLEKYSQYFNADMLIYLEGKLSGLTDALQIVQDHH